MVNGIVAQPAAQLIGADEANVTPAGAENAHVDAFFTVAVSKSRPPRTPTELRDDDKVTTGAPTRVLIAATNSAGTHRLETTTKAATPLRRPRFRRGVLER